VTKTVKIKLLTTPEQSEALQQTVILFNQICNWFSQKAFAVGEFRKNQLQKLFYQECREAFPGFSSQLTIRAIDVVCQAYKLDKRVERVFRKYSAAVYDQRVLAFKLNDEASIWSVKGRFNVPIQVWNKQLFNQNRGQADLICQNGKWFLHLAIWAEDEPIKPAQSFLGVDLGVVNIAATSDGKIFTAQAIEKKRQQYSQHRQRLQLCKSRNAKRRIRKTKKKESGFRKDVNHRIAKELVRVAKGTARGIAIENLKGIQQRTTVRKAQRNQRMSWSFFQLRQFMEYKAADAGVPVVIVDPRNTSRRCFACGHIDKRNRRSQDKFQCCACGHSDQADLNAAKNIAFRAVVNPPIAAATASLQAHDFSRG